MKLKIFLLALAISIGQMLYAQDMLDSLMSDKPQKEYVESAFKSSRVIMSHSMEMLKPGILDFRILHRFGNVNQGVKEFFGLDQATIRLSLDYAINKDLTVGLGRSKYKKELDAFIKYRPIQQATGPKALPFSLVLVAGTTLQTGTLGTPGKDSLFTNRMSYYWQAIVGRKFCEAFTFQLVPTLVHRNLVPLTADPNDTYALGAGGRIKLSRRVSFNFDYYYVVNKDKSLQTYDPLSIGFDIETGGHVFQLHFTNAVGMNERAFITETTNDWGKGDIQFGFNISRAFQIKKRKS
jgi:hypothetical protein